MIAIDTNILIAALVRKHAWYDRARKVIESLSVRNDVLVSEFALTELYVLLRNPAVIQPALGAEAAAEICQSFRKHPRWRTAGFPNDSLAFHHLLWQRAATPGIARRRIYDLRHGLSLVQFGVKEFLTANVADFQGIGFVRVSNPLD